MSSDSWSVKGIGSSNIHVCGYGAIDFFVTINGTQQTATIERVLDAPGLGTNLISIAAVTNFGLSVHFIETRVTFAKGQAVIIVGERIGESLYHLSIHSRLSAANSINPLSTVGVPGDTTTSINSCLASAFSTHKLQDHLQDAQESRGRWPHSSHRRPTLPPNNAAMPWMCERKDAAISFSSRPGKGQ